MADAIIEGKGVQVLAPKEEAAAEAVPMNPAEIKAANIAEGESDE
jgi:hypothetical protein